MEILKLGGSGFCISAQVRVRLGLGADEKWGGESVTPDAGVHGCHRQVQSTNDYRTSI